MQLIIVSGRSGSGKSAALHAMEDAGYCCIDNLPARFLPELISEKSLEQPSKGFAVSIDVRNLGTDLKLVPELVKSIRTQVQSCRILFLDASTDTLVRRFNETRRKHPLSDGNRTLAEALSMETELLREISEVADSTVITDKLTHYDLQQILRSSLGLDTEKGSQLLIQSFGYKYGIPASADYLFDVRTLPNPHWVPELRALSGLDTPVIDYLESKEQVANMYQSLETFLDRWIPEIFAGSRSYLCVAVGCTGGKHRSVFMTERLYRHFQQSFDNVQVRHREL